MKITFQQTILFSLLSIFSVGAEENSTNAPAGPPDVQKVSYALGMNIGLMEKASGSSSRTDVPTFVRAISDVLDSRETDIKESEVKKVLEKAATDVPLSEADRKKISYAGGMRMAVQIASKFPDAKSAGVVEGFYDALGGRPTKVKPEEISPLLKQAMEWGQLRQADKNKAEGAAFISKYAREPGVQILPDGLHYRVLKEGAGAIPNTNDQVFIKVRGRYPNGKLFIKHNHYLVRCGGGCQGWQDTLPRMKIGSRWEAVIPPSIGFGDQGEIGWGVGPNATTVWTFEMVSIAPPNAEFGRGRLGHAFEDSDIPDSAEDQAADAAEAAKFAKK